MAPNAPGMEYQALSIVDLEKRTGIDVFPKISPEIKATKMMMPVLTPHGYKKSLNAPTQVDYQRGEMMSAFKPFKKEEDSFAMDELTVGKRTALIGFQSTALHKSPGTRRD